MMKPELDRKLAHVPWMNLTELRQLANIAAKDARTEYWLARRWADDRGFRSHAWARQDNAANYAELARACLFELIDRKRKGRR